MENGYYNDLKDILIVLHGEFKNDIDNNHGDGNYTNAGTEDSIGVYDNTNGLSASILTELYWEVFDQQKKQSLNGIQSIKQEDLSTLDSIKQVIQEYQQYPISILITDMRLYHYIKQLDLKWLYSYEFYDILQQSEYIFSVRKNHIKELLDYFSLSDDSPYGQKSETFQTNLLVSKLVIIILSTNIPFKNPINNSIMKQTQDIQSQELATKFFNYEDIKQDIQNDNKSTDNMNNLEQNHETSIIIKTSKENALKELFVENKQVIEDEKYENNDQKFINQIVGNFQNFSASEQSGNVTINNINMVQIQKQLILSNNSENESNVKELNNIELQSLSDDQDSRRSRSRSKDNQKDKKVFSSGSKSSSSSSCNSLSSSCSNSKQHSESDSRGKNIKKSEIYSYLKLRGIPYNARESELQEFLGITLEKSQMSFKYDKDGRFCGECIIRTNDQKQYENIKQMNMKHMGKRYIEVFEAEKTDFKRAKESVNIDDIKRSEKFSNSKHDVEFLQNIGIVKIRGLPFNSTDQDIQQFFKDSQIIPNGIQKVYEGRRPTGEAFVLFSTKQDASKAIEKDKQRMGSRYIEIFLSHPKEYTTVIKNRKQYQVDGKQVSTHTNRFSNYGNGGNRFDKFNNNGGYSLHYSYRNNEGKYGNQNSKYNSPSLHINGSQYFKNTQKIGNNNNGYDRNQKTNNFKDNIHSGGNKNDEGNKYNRQNYYQNNNQKQIYMNNRNNNYQNGFQHRSRDYQDKSIGNTQFQRGQNQQDEYAYGKKSHQQYSQQHHPQQGQSQQYTNLNQQGALQQDQKQLSQQNLGDNYHSQLSSQQKNQYSQENNQQQTYQNNVQQFQYQQAQSQQYYQLGNIPQSQQFHYQNQPHYQVQNRNQYDMTNLSNQQQLQYNQFHHPHMIQQQHPHQLYYTNNYQTDQQILGHNQAYEQQVTTTDASLLLNGANQYFQSHTNQYEGWQQIIFK